MFLLQELEDACPSPLTPYLGAYVHAGFPSPAKDYEDKKLDLNEYLVKNPISTFFIKIDGNSFLWAGLHSGDLLVVDRSLDAKNNNIVLAYLNGRFTVKRVAFIKSKVFVSSGEKSSEILEGEDFLIWGVVIGCVHKFLI
ncbi:MAG: translesion error-prone DNA polymerase V autoproteolytic subunit [Chitinophagaceae bacterium]|jgi:DNA polymerase V|nr:translesion error-prone DNA polymerase V autoproteolytic subunit [Chitinophagaceae bacterium]